MSEQREQKSKSFVVCPSRDAGPHNLSSGQLNVVWVCVCAGCHKIFIYYHLLKRKTNLNLVYSSVKKRFTYFQSSFFISD